MKTYQKYRANVAILFCLVLLVARCDHPGTSRGNAGTLNQESTVKETDSIADYGADQYGMKRYVMAFLKRGPNRSHDTATIARIQREHLDNISRMAENGQLVLAGPFLDDQEIRGIYIFNVPSIEEAEKLTASDPAIKAGRLKMELHPWYGSAALLDLNQLHKKIAKKNI